MLSCVRSACQRPGVNLLVDQYRRDGEPRRCRPAHTPGEFQRRFVPDVPGELVTPQIAGHLGHNLYLAVASPPTTEGTRLQLPSDRHRGIAARLGQVSRPRGADQGLTSVVV